MKHNRLLIVSDTRLQFHDGHWYGFNSVVKELEVFSEIFNEITWIGFDYNDCMLDGTMTKINPAGITIIQLPRTGGFGLFSKLKALIQIPRYFIAISCASRNADVIHSRGPSIPMLITLMNSFFYKRPRYWFKYANNWNEKSSSMNWRIQKFLMLMSKQSVGTINGNWPKTPNHILAFENPCLYDQEATCSSAFETSKSISNGWRLLFVGRIESSKGIFILLDSLKSVSEDHIDSLSIIGDGSERKILQQAIKDHPYSKKINFLGPLAQDLVKKHMFESHFLCLPTFSSEGFPKVIAEAWSSGCVPIVSDVSCVSQYVQHAKNGFLWEIKSEKKIFETIFYALQINEKQYFDIVNRGKQMCDLFTYSRYKQRVLNEVICD